MVSRTETPKAGVATTTNSAATQVATKTGTSTTSGSSNQRQTTATDYLDPTSRAALEQLLKQLSDPTSQANQFSQQRLDEIGTNQEIRKDYTKSAAFADALAAMQSNLAKGIESQLPAITAGIDAAGTSGSAMSALLTQKAAEDSARNAAELGLQAAISYGQIQTGLGGVLEQLTAAGDPVTNQLLAALGVAKGASESSTVTSSGSSKQTTNSLETGVTTTTGTESSVSKAIDDTKKQATKTAEKFPGMSTPGYSKTPAVPSSGVSTGAGSTTYGSYKGAYGF